MKPCRVCRTEFDPRTSTQRVCSMACACTLNKQKREKAYRAETKALKQQIKPRSKWIKETQAAFNRFIRTRDAANNMPCISCGEYYAEPFNGQVWDCGHYLSVGAYPELRLNEFNAHRQHSRCNRGAAISKRNDKSVAQKYRINLISRIGIELVEWLESPHEPQKPTIEELRFLKKYYNDQAKMIKSRAGSG